MTSGSDTGSAYLLDGGCASLRSSVGSGMVTPWLNMLDGLVLAGAFFYLNRKVYTNSKAALAGISDPNVVRISVYVWYLQATSVWAVVWGIFKMFTVQSGNVSPTNADEESSNRLHAIAMGLVEAYTIFLEVGLTCILVSSSLGVRAFKRAIALAALAAVAVFCGNYITITDQSGPELVDNIYKPLLLWQTVQYAVRAAGFIILAVYRTNYDTERNAVVFFSSFLGMIYTLWAFGALLTHREEDCGLCISDLTMVLYFAYFAPVVYRTVTKDSSYWASSTGAQRELDQSGYLQNHQDILIPCNELYYLRQLGSGGKGVVDLYAWQRRHVAVKRLLLPQLTRTVIQNFEEEAAMLAQLEHPNVVRFEGVYVDPPKMGLVMEYCERGDLFDALAARTLRHPLNVARDIARGMVYLQSRPQPFIHRDLKSLNVLLAADWSAKIADFGECRTIKQCFHSHMHGTPAWAAPELLTREELSLRTDVFSFGVILWEILTYHTPFVVVPPKSRVNNDKTKRRSTTSRRAPPPIDQPNAKKSGSNDDANLSQPLLVSSTSAESEDVEQGIPSPAHRRPPGHLNRVELSSLQLAIKFVVNRQCRPPVPIGVPEVIIDLMQRCWEADPLRRPPFHEILQVLEGVDIPERCFPFALPP